MKALHLFLIYTVLVFASGVSADDSCECPKLTCREQCEIEQDLTFYSEKCEAGKRVKSCARPTCVPVQSPPAFCGQPQAAKPVEAEKSVERTVASEKREPALAIGKVDFIEGLVKRTSIGSDEPSLNVGDQVFEGDRVETDTTGKARIIFDSGNIMTITPNTQVVITEMRDTQKTNKRVLLDLLKGKIRNKVNESYKDEQSYFRVRTKTAVAGVRGTDFVVSAEADDRSLFSKVEAFDGLVELSDHDLVNKTPVRKGEWSRHTIAISDIVSGKPIKGAITAPEKMKDDYLISLNNETTFRMGGTVVAKKKDPVVSQDMPICSSPRGRLNECSWTCENNPLGESRCRTDKVGVQCVRRFCNANGVWSQPMRVPASHSEACKGDQPTIKPCDF